MRYYEHLTSRHSDNMGYREYHLVSVVSVNGSLVLDMTLVQLRGSIYPGHGRYHKLSGSGVLMSV